MSSSFETSVRVGGGVLGCSCRHWPHTQGGTEKIPHIFSVCVALPLYAQAIRTLAAPMHRAHVCRHGRVFPPESGTAVAPCERALTHCARAPRAAGVTRGATVATYRACTVYYHPIATRAGDIIAIKTSLVCSLLNIYKLKGGRNKKTSFAMHVQMHTV